MKVERLTLSGFRNIEDMEFYPHPAVNVIYGDNAQGKTNLLESIWLFTGARSFRGAKDGDYIKFGREKAALGLSFTADNRPQTADISFEQGGTKKNVLLNEIKAESRAELSGSFCAVLFSPDHLEIVKKEPQKRRRMIDMSLCQAYPKYRKILDNYERILRQRSFLLKDAGTSPGLIETLEIWDDTLAKYGGYIIWMRERYIRKLSAYAAQEYDGISSGRERFSTKYLATCGEIPENAERGEVTSMMEKALKKSRERDVRMGITHIGPHRDDLDIYIDARSVKSFGSQGQQRSCVLALKLAECRILQEGMGEPPVVLLDDVMSELDEGRRGYLLNSLTKRQIFITCCDKELTANLNVGKMFAVNSGRITGADKGGG